MVTVDPKHAHLQRQHALGNWLPREVEAKIRVKLLVIFRKTTTDHKNFNPFVVLFDLMRVSVVNFNTNIFAII